MQQKRGPQTTEEMQAAARRMMERQAEQSEQPRRRKRTNGSPFPLPGWLTPEKLTYHQAVMQQRQAEDEANRAAQRAKEQAVQTAHQERQRIVKEQERRRGLFKESLTNIESHPLIDELVEGLLDKTWQTDTALVEDLVQGLYRARLIRPLTELEQQYFSRSVFQTRTPLPYLEKHPCLLVDEFYPRLDVKAKLFATLTGLLRGQPREARLLEQLKTHHGTVMPMLLKIAELNLPLVERLPWQAQYRVAVTWLVSGYAGLSGVKWNARVAAAIAVGQATTPAHARASLDALFDDVAQSAYETADPLDFTPLVPPCRVERASCTHCEGRPWPTKRGVAFCPTLREPCPLDGPGNTMIFGLPGMAWIRADTSLPAAQWSVLELLRFAGFKPRDLYPELPRDEDLVSRLGGWLNRLNKIRSLMHCRTCTQIMRPNKRYAKFFAKYPVTIFQCEAHPANVKLTQCWLCDELIDSRDSRFFDGESTYNICVGCGAGEQKQATTGRRCPQCGVGPMNLLGGLGWTLECCRRDCGHRLVLTEKQKQYLAPEIAARL